MDLDNFKHNLRRLNKCDQIWDEMSPIPGGRLCRQCSRKIVDFSGMTHTEIAVFMSEQTGPVCGFYLPEQLPHHSGKIRSIPLSIGFSTLLATTTVSHANAASEQPPVCRTDHASRINVSPLQASPAPKPADSVLVRGIVQSYDSTTKTYKPISYAAIIIKGLKTGVSTNEKGEFHLYVPTHPEFPSPVLVGASVGYASKELTLPSDARQELDLGAITLQSQPAIEYYIVVRKRSRLSRFWRKITKPFR